MGELRLYALGIEELRGIPGAPEATAARLRQVAQQTFAPAAAVAQTSWAARLGPIFRRPPATPVVSPTQPEPHDVEVLLAGAHVPPERVGATWRVLEVLVAGVAWGSTRLPLTSSALDDLDFALARGGVPASVGLRHLLGHPAGLNLQAVTGLTVGWHPYATALAMAMAYRAARPALGSAEQQEVVDALARWLEGFIAWAALAPSLDRPVPDLVAFHAA